MKPIFISESIKNYKRIYSYIPDWIIPISFKFSDRLGRPVEQHKGLIIDDNTKISEKINTIIIREVIRNKKQGIRFFINNYRKCNITSVFQISKFKTNYIRSSYNYVMVDFNTLRIECFGAISEEIIDTIMEFIRGNYFSSAIESLENPVVLRLP